MQVDTLSAYEHAGAPMHLRWGLYSGSRLYPSVRDAYFAAFNKLMFADTRALMLTKLRALPEVPTPADDYGDNYGLLKAYIVTTSHPEKSTADFLAPVLMTRWLNGRSVDSTRATLARRQFETYANELRYANPFPDTADAKTVEKARTFLRQFAKSEQIYQYMLAEAGKANRSVQFNRAVAGSASYIVDTYEVPGAFTKGGSDSMLKAFKSVDKYLSGERWVVGDDAAGVDKAKLVADLQSRYAEDYATQWRKYLSSAQVRRYDGVKDAAAKLQVLSSNQSTLLALFSIASTNTAIGLGDLSKKFQPVQLVTPPNVTDKLIGDKNAQYMSALLALQTSLEKTANSQGQARDQAAGQAITDASAARNAARQVASGFIIDQQGQVSTVVQNLMEAPITYAEQLLKTFGSDEINARGRQFCAQARATLAKYPFNPDGATQASLQEVAAIVRPGSGSLWKLYNDALASLVPKQGNQYVVKSDASTKVSDRLVGFLNRASVFADAMFKDDTPEPHISFQVQPLPGELPSVSIALDGPPVRSTTGGNSEMARIDWPGTQHEARLSAGPIGQERTIAGPFNGPWAVFQLFNAADEWKTVGSTVNVGWDLAARRGAAANTALKVIVQLVAAGPEATLLRKGSLAGADVCTTDIAR
jgi:type VI secretion system protein ImpL